MRSRLVSCVVILAAAAAGLSACSGEAPEEVVQSSMTSQATPSASPSERSERDDAKSRITRFIEAFATMSSSESGKDIVNRRVKAGALPSGSGASDPTWDIPEWSSLDIKQELESISYIEIDYPLKDGKTTVDVGFVVSRQEAGRRAQEIMFVCKMLYTERSDDGFIYGAECVEGISDLEEA